MVLSTALCMCVTLVILSYLLHEPLPAEITSNRWQLKFVLGVSKAGENLIEFLGYFGVNEAVALRLITDRILTTLSFHHHHGHVKSFNEVFDGVAVRVFIPNVVHKRTVIYLHGGGWYMGSSDTYAPKMEHLALKVEAVVISVDYRLSPEHVYPAAVDDCEKATIYFLRNAHKYGVDKDRVAIMGDSAGGNLVAAVSIRLRRLQTNYPKLQVLIYPITQVVNFDTPSYRNNQNGPLLTKRMMALSISNYIFGTNSSMYINEFMSNNHTISTIQRLHHYTTMNIGNLPKDQLIKNYKGSIQPGNEQLWDMIKDKVLDESLSPLLSKNLSGVPPAYVVTCQHDILRDDGLFYVQKLRSNGVNVTHHHLTQCIHGSMDNYKYIPIFSKHYLKLISYVSEIL